MHKIFYPFFIFLASSLVACTNLELKQQQIKTNCSLLTKALDDASKITGLANVREPRCLELDKNQFKKAAISILKKELFDKRLYDEEHIFKILKFIPADYSFKECLLSGFLTEAAAFYSPTEDTVYIPSWYNVPYSILIHEAVHALQHQNYPLIEASRSYSLFSDRALAVGAALEGHATIAEEEYLKKSKIQQQFNMSSDTKLPLQDYKCALPEALKELFYFQYDYGALYYARLKAFNLIKDHNEPLLNVPLRTIEVLNPRKYYSNIKRNYYLKNSDTYSDSLGAFIIRSILLTNKIPKKDALKISYGWKGDLLLFRSSTTSPSQHSFTWNTKWSSNEIAQAFADALSKIVKKEDSYKINETEIYIRGLEIRQNGHQVKVNLRLHRQVV